MKKLADSVRKAAYEASSLLTSNVQSMAAQSNWDEDVTNSTQVMFDGSGYQVAVNSDLKSRAMDLEYGTPSRRPTAVLRKSSNRTQEIEEMIIKSVERELGVNL